MISRKQDAKSVLCRLAENTVEIISIRKIGTNSNILACFGSCGKIGFDVYCIFRKIHLVELWITEKEKK